MKAGRLRHKVLIESETITQDAYGAPTRTWATFATVWASVMPLSGREYFEAGKTMSDVSTRIQIRYGTGITPQMRVKFGTRIYSIVSVINMDERNKEIELFCKEIA